MPKFPKLTWQNWENTSARVMFLMTQARASKEHMWKQDGGQAAGQIT